MQDNDVKALLSSLGISDYEPGVIEALRAVYNGVLPKAAVLF